MKHYFEDIQKVMSDLNVAETGLSAEEAQKRLAKNGKNKLDETKKEPLIKKFFASLADPMIIMLIAAAIIQAVVTVIEAKGSPTFGDFADVFVILIVVIINSVMSLVQESKSEAAMEALMQMTAATSKVLRDGEMVVIKSEDIVTGDVVVLEAGDAVPADYPEYNFLNLLDQAYIQINANGITSSVTCVVMALRRKQETAGKRK